MAVVALDRVAAVADPPSPFASLFAVTEFVARLYLAARDAGNKIEVKMVDAITYNNTTRPGQTKTLQFKANPAGVPGTVVSRSTVLYA